MVVEVMGRDTGWIALEAGIAGGAHVILIPEIPFTIANIRRYIEKRLSIGKRFTIIVIAEGCPLPADMRAHYGEERRKLPRFGAIGNLVGQELGRELKREVRVAVLGHIQRGGSPSPFDRILSTRFGVAAVDLAARGGFGQMVCLRGDAIEAVSIEEACGKQKLGDPHGQLVYTAKSGGIYLG